jgi:hypothetical protein
MYNYYGYYYMIKYGHLDDVTMIVRWMTPLHCLIVNSDNKQVQSGKYNNLKVLIHSEPKCVYFLKRGKTKQKIM